MSLYLPQRRDDLSNESIILNDCRKKIVVAEDDENVIDFYREFIEDFSEATTEKIDASYCKNGADVFTYLDVQLPNLMFLDLVMPKVGGIEVLNKLNQIESKIPIVIVSGFLDEKTVAQCTKRGACYFVSKPFSYADISKYLKLY